LFNFFLIQGSTFSGLQITQRNWSNLEAFNFLHRITKIQEHFFNLPVCAFFKKYFQPLGAGQPPDADGKSSSSRD